MATTRGVSEVYVEYLRFHGFPSHYSRGPNQYSYRILVGPLDDQEQQDKYLAQLEMLGFRPFRRMFPIPSDQ